MNNDYHHISRSVAIIGLGYVGIPLSIRFAKKGFNVLGFEVDKKKLETINLGKSYINHINESEINFLIKKGFIATDDFSKIRNVEAIIICVPTPLGNHKEPDLSYIHSSLKSIKPHLNENQLLVLESTTYPGTTDEVIIPFINSITKDDRKRFIIGESFYVGYSPEREDPGNKKFSTKTIPKVVSGATNNCLKKTKALYDEIIETVVPVSAPKVAEMTKILENIHRAVNIGLVNELKMVADKMDIDIFEVINAASTKPFGFTPYYPGPGLGGHCIPIDPFYLTWKAKSLGMNTRFIELAGEINTYMPNYVIDKLTLCLNLAGKSVSESKILILGLAYKKNIDDIRESPSIAIINSLLKNGSLIEYSDPFVHEITLIGDNKKIILKSIKLKKENIQKFDAVLLLTDHDIFDYDLIFKNAKLIIDTRGKFKKSPKVITA